MLTTSSSTSDIVSAILVLIKATWKSGSSLSKLEQDTRVVDNTIKSLAQEVKSLSSECDLIYSELEESISKNPTVLSRSRDVDVGIWSGLAIQIEETCQILQELESCVQNIREEECTFAGQRRRKLDQSKEHIANIRIKIRRRTPYLHLLQLLIKTTLWYITPQRADRGLSRELENLQDAIEKLQGSPRARLDPTIPHAEAALIQTALDTIAKGRAMCGLRLPPESVAGSHEGLQDNTRVVEWVGTLDSISRARRSLVPSEGFTTTSSIFSGHDLPTATTSTTSEQYNVHEGETENIADDDSDDDLSADLAKAALETGTNFFGANEWVEADSLFQEALRLLQQIPKKQRVFCDPFDLQYRLAVCAYHTQEPAKAEEALINVIQQSAVSDKQRVQIYNAAHLLALLCIRMNQLDRARSECTKVLQARRRFLGKHSDASLESTVLVAHIYFLLSNRARARSCLAMVPESRRSAVLRSLEESLGTKLEHLETPVRTPRPMSGNSDVAMDRITSMSSMSSLGLTDDRFQDSESRRESLSSVTSHSQSHQRFPSHRTLSEGLEAVTLASSSSTQDRRESRPVRQELMDPYKFESPALLASAPILHTEHVPTEVRRDFDGKPMPRKEVLEKVGCHPRDNLEEAVCDGDSLAFTRLMNKRKDSWRSKLRKRTRPERVTALHFAALFGEIEMARQLLAADFNVNEIPFGYSTELTPLKFAVGARQVEMVEFLITYGAKPSKSGSWSTMAGQLMNRSWIDKTMSKSEKEFASDRMVAILKILLKHGWHINVPIDTSGRTILHQAVGFWTGSYKWDLSLRAAITNFLCDQGADPLQPNAEGKTPYDIALASGDQALLQLVSRGLKHKDTDDWLPVELAA